MMKATIHDICRGRAGGELGSIDRSDKTKSCDTAHEDFKVNETLISKTDRDLHRNRVWTSIWEWPLSRLFFLH